jgi:NitT/TauT family transport system substrate-binding protein
MKKLSIIFLCLTLSLMLVVNISCNKKVKEQRTYNIGIVTWIGYGPLFVAKEKGFFKEEGLNIDIKIMDGPGQRESAYLAGELDFFPNTPDAFAIFATQGAKGKMIMPMDESWGADGLVAIKGINTIKDLKGKKVGFQSGITSHFFFLYLLNQAGLSGKDVQQENLGAGEAGAAFVAGKLDAAVTWEPWLTKAKELPTGHVLATSKDTPGLLVDVLMVSHEILKQNRNDVLAFMKAWFKTINYFKEDTEECIPIIANAFKLSETDVKEMLLTDHFFSLGESKTYFGSIEQPGKVFDIFDMAAKLYKENNVIESIPSINDIIDISLLNDIKID